MVHKRTVLVNSLSFPGFVTFFEKGYLVTPPSKSRQVRISPTFRSSVSSDSGLCESTLMFWWWGSPPWSWKPPTIGRFIDWSVSSRSSPWPFRREPVKDTKSRTPLVQDRVLFGHFLCKDLFPFDYCYHVFGSHFVEDTGRFDTLMRQTNECCPRFSPTKTKCICHWHRWMVLLDLL